MNLKIEHVLIAVLAAMALGIIANPLKPAAIGGTGTTTTIPQGIQCESTVTPDITITAYDVDNPTSAVTDAYNLYRKIPNGVWTSWTLGTEITNLEIGATYEFFIPGSTTTSDIVAKAFGKYFTWTALCQEDISMKIYVANDELYGSVTGTFVNADDNPTTAEVFSAGQTQTIRLRWISGKDEYFGNPYLNTYPLTDNTNWRRQYPDALCLKLNSTAWEVPQDVYLSDGTKLNRISSPTISNADGATTHTMYCYESPVIGDMQTDIYLRLEADGTYAPSVDDTAYLYCGNTFINSKTGEMQWGVENNLAAYTCGNGDAPTITLDWT